ncbi:NAD-dependent epimerase/dehydratase family protein [Paenibacillus sp. PsM32]|uniref:NAD-dependent epimerase/dehydratase family protein n=1 Tax=Paenibacillus sp. PsM32 TaxID=3030536 RepID=UPI00263AF1E1|nr:NAD-dependent epimerase/dehydratase family protein [Paenibacillus sp. PsM32]MDN4620958.1 NAD-dependent epimerase/dehydratase family protein [Paenibacillus sp. PsM32]
MIKKAIVTGATGFIGFNLVKRLLLENWDVDIIIRKNSDISLLKCLSPLINVYVYDENFESLNTALSYSKPNVIFHLASFFKSDHDSNEINHLIYSNILFGTQLLEAMSKNNIVNLVNTGTSWEHFENSTYNPVNLYAATKHAFQDIIFYYINTKKINCITLKLYDTYGENDNRAKLLKILKQVYISGETLQMTAGEQLFNLVHINDVIDAFMLASHYLIINNKYINSSYAVSAKSLISLKQLVDLIEQIIQHPLPIEWGEKNYKEREVMIPWNNGITLPGWQPQMELMHGLSIYFSK